MSRLARNSSVDGRQTLRSFSGPTVSIEEEQGLGVAKIILRTPSTHVLGSLQAALGLALPETPNVSAKGEGFSIACIAPGEWLLIGEEAAVEQARAAAASALAGRTALVLELTHGRAAFRLCGAGARDVLCAYTPLDFHPCAFTSGACARSLFGECGAFIHRLDDAPTWRLIVDQSYSAYAWRLLDWAGAALVNGGQAGITTPIFGSPAPPLRDTVSRRES